MPDTDARCALTLRPYTAPFQVIELYESEKLQLNDSFEHQTRQLRQRFEAEKVTSLCH